MPPQLLLLRLLPIRCLLLLLLAIVPLHRPRSSSQGNCR